MATAQEKYDALKKALQDLDIQVTVKTPNHLGAVMRIVVEHEELESEIDFVFNRNMALQQVDITPLNYDVTYVNPL